MDNTLVSQVALDGKDADPKTSSVIGMHPSLLGPERQVTSVAAGQEWCGGPART
jgi:hypothetical protein